jgi:hypothetical protein
MKRFVETMSRPGRSVASPQWSKWPINHERFETVNGAMALTRPTWMSIFLEQLEILHGVSSRGISWRKERLFAPTGAALQRSV